MSSTVSKNDYHDPLPIECSTRDESDPSTTFKRPITPQFQSHGSSTPTLSSDGEYRSFKLNINGTTPRVTVAATSAQNVPSPATERNATIGQVETVLNFQIDKKPSLMSRVIKGAALGAALGAISGGILGAGIGVVIGGIGGAIVGAIFGLFSENSYWKSDGSETLEFDPSPSTDPVEVNYNTISLNPLGGFNYQPKFDLEISEFDDDYDIIPTPRKGSDLSGELNQNDWANNGGDEIIDISIPQGTKV